MKIAWISFFPVEWLPDLPQALRGLPLQHPASWQRVLLHELRQIPDVKLHILVVRTEFARSCAFDWKGVTFHCLKVPKGLRTLTLFSWETISIRRCLATVQPDLVHAWGSERGAALVASRLPYPYLVTMQGLLEWYSEQVTLNWHHRLEARLERVALRRASLVTTESRFAVGWLQHRYPHLEILQAEHAPDWLFHHLQRQPKTKPIRFLFVGNMGTIKGTDLLLSALDGLQTELDFHLTVVGSASPDFLHRIKSLTSASLWNRITLLHNLTPKQVADEVTRATLMLFPTRADTSPNSVKEAVVAGLPVIASAIGGIVDYVLPGQNGLTFPAGDAAAFNHAIRAALVHPLFSQGMVENQSLLRMRTYLSPHQMCERFQIAYRRVLDKARLQQVAKSHHSDVDG